MAKQKFTGEYEINASASLLFSYLTIPKSMSLWFADSVTQEKDVYNFKWEGEDHKAKIVAQKQNQYVRYEFISDNDASEPSYIEFTIEENELTQTSFIRITDCSDDSEEDMRELWNYQIESLREAVGA
ncbi:MAG: START-like domain-containing protein [Cytophagaceae bacterium]|nr:START-like domain-containing protein [Cytophagaceae bacterium]MDW8455243.1 START-like domain-containing protein [Cytophagaceae bacterium]